MKSREENLSIPLGKREDQKLEFKGKDAASDWKKIARDVVAMLNASGGEIWVGLREDNGFAVEAEALEDAGKTGDSLWNHLVEVVEPPPSREEVEIEPVSLEKDRGEVLRIEVKGKEEKRPYALLGKEGSRRFLLRVGPRIRPMEREEIFHAPAGKGKNGEETREKVEAMEILRKAREEILQEEGRFFWIGFQPEGALELDLDGEEEKELKRLLRNPEATGCRPEGWGFANPYAPVISSGQGWRLDLRHPNRMEVREDGGIRFQREIGSFLAGRKGDRLNGLALLETAVSLFRLARALYQKEGLSKKEFPRIWVDAALVGVEGLILPPGRLDLWVYVKDVNPPGKAPSDLVFLPRPMEVEKKDLEDPHDCGMRLVRRIYRAFGLGAEAIPMDFLKMLERGSR